MSNKRVGVYWFCNDLRLHDNPALMQATSLVDQLVCVAVAQNKLGSPKAYTQITLGESRHRFAIESLHQLNHELSELGQQLCYVSTNIASTLSDLIDRSAATDVFRSENAGYYENTIWAYLEARFPKVKFHSVHTHTLFDLDDLPFNLVELPPSFTKFKNVIGELKPNNALVTISYLPPRPSGLELENPLPMVQPLSTEKPFFIGGERAALKHVDTYFSGVGPAEYKLVRNNLDGWDHSTKLSAWLANGCLSVREVYGVLTDYETSVVANESTYWIYFELLWREFFQWYAHKNGKDLFGFSGIKGLSPLNSYYPERFKKWINGNTPYPIVNACMNELAQTGYLSNRGRQIVASCFVNELAMDWRFGAAYFESVLVDYDVASNWGNWQYLAGVGADARDKRHFNLQKQTQIHDPQGQYIDKWNGLASCGALDSVDAADWPIV